MRCIFSSWIQNYTHAEDAFTHVLKLDMKCIDAKHELNEVRIQQLIVRVIIIFIFSRDLYRFYGDL